MSNLSAAFDAYQAQAMKTAVYHRPCIDKNVPPGLYAALGLGSEAGEVLDVLKKHLRDGGTLALRTAQRDKLEAELGDVLWYVAAVAQEHGLTLGGVAETNLRKLAARAAHGTIHGTGDDR